MMLAIRVVMCHTAKQTAVRRSQRKGHCGGKAVIFKTERKYPGWHSYRAQILDLYGGAEMLLGKLKRLSPCFPFTKV